MRKAIPTYIWIDKDILNIFQTELCSKISDVDISKIFCFELEPKTKDNRIHLASLLRGNNQPEKYFSVRQVRRIIPHLDSLNKIFKEYLEFSYNNSCLVSISRVWQQKPSFALWYVG